MNQNQEYQELKEERKAVKYIAESEMEDSASIDSSSSIDLDPSSSKSIGSLLKTKNTQDKLNKKLEIENSFKNKKNKSKFQSNKNLIQTRSNKHAPIEITSKKPVTRKRNIIQVPKIEIRDPRFDSLSGALNQELHEKSYHFLKLQKNLEIEKLRELIKNSKNSKNNEIEKLKEKLSKEENKLIQKEKIDREKLAIKVWKSTEKEKRKEGKGAFYLKRKAQKEIILADRYQHLSQNKFKLHKSIEKKRKKIDGKEKKSMPFSRPIVFT